MTNEQLLALSKTLNAPIEVAEIIVRPELLFVVAINRTRYVVVPKLLLDSDDPYIDPRGTSFQQECEDAGARHAMVMVNKELPLSYRWRLTKETVPPTPDGRRRFVVRKPTSTKPESMVLTYNEDGVFTVGWFYSRAL